MEIDESSFTGETSPSLKHTEPQAAAAAHNDISQLRNIAFMGTFVCGGHGKVKIKYRLFIQLKLNLLTIPFFCSKCSITNNPQ